MIGGFIHPGKPMANMYFVLFSYSKCRAFRRVYLIRAFFVDSVTQAQLLLRDLKIAQCNLTTLFVLNQLCHKFCIFLDVKLPPRAAFTAQIIGTLLGSILNFGLFLSLYPAEAILNYATFYSADELYR